METVIVLLIVGLAVVAGVRIFCRAVKGKGGYGCSGNCNTCNKAEMSNNG